MNPPHGNMPARGRACHPKWDAPFANESLPVEPDGEISRAGYGDAGAPFGGTSSVIDAK